MARIGWAVIDRRTGAPVTRALFLTSEDAEAHITKQQDQYARDGRDDATRYQLLLNMEPAEFNG